MKNFYIMTPDETNQFDLSGETIEQAIQQGMLDYEFSVAVDEYGDPLLSGWHIEELEIE